MKTTRRQFIESTTAAFAIPTIIPRCVLAQGKTVGANDKIIVGFVGAGGRAKALMTHLPMNRVKMVALADCWLAKTRDCVRTMLEQGLIEKESDLNQYHSDLEMYDKEKLDASFVITQDFCRTLAGINAVQAGLDVYAEKALTTYIAEGRTLVQWVRKTNRVFQVGSQQRSMRLNRFGCDLIRSGKLGQVKLVQGINYPGPQPIPDDLQPEECPSDFNWDAWQGPTRNRPFSMTLASWLPWWDYSGWELTNWGAHGIDMIQCALKKDDTGPVELWPLDPNEPDVRVRKVAAKYADGLEVRFDLDQGPWGGGVFRCENGNLEINRNHLKSNPPSLIADTPEPDPPEGPDNIAGPHMNNFFDCMISRRQPRADVEYGHRTASLCHLIGICREVNRKITWDPVKEEIIDDAEANAKVRRPRRKGYELPIA